MSVNYKNGAIVVNDLFAKSTKYDVANNLITAQFDGRGAISKYAVMNKYSVFSAYYSLYALNGKPLDWSSQKQVEMVGRRQITNFEEKEANIEIIQFLDRTHNCIYSFPLIQFDLHDRYVASVW